MSLGIFAFILIAALFMLLIDRRTRGRIAFAIFCALMLGVVIAGSDGVLSDPARALVDGVRSGLTVIGQSLGGGK
jgi:L-lactate permease